MKVLTLALLLSLTAAKPAQPVRQPSSQLEQHAKGGRWYFAASGHAVYCYGPVMTLPQANGDLQKVATFCRNGKTVVPLKD
ncbi:MAG TPA: hypothetical protein VN310_00800 [Candidatus Dormibacteraeota bacterium]|jgi:hypothetical protein|nr:hypothetical protein [Candidatus Dormibacteraeota bacterium]